MLKELKHMPLEHDHSGDIVSHRVSYQHGDYEDVTDLGEMAFYERMQTSERKGE